MDRRAREQELTNLKALANHFLDFYRKEGLKNPGGWKIHVVQRNSEILKRIISKLNRNLKRTSIEEYLAAFPSSETADIENLESKFSTILAQRVDVHELIQCSPRISYYNDFTWFHHGTIGEHRDYALGKADESVFNKYLPYQIQKIEDWKNTFFTNAYFQEDQELAKSILRLVQSKELVSANILTITLIEGIGRKFCRLVFAKQNPNLSESEIERNIYSVPRSFDDLIRNTNWLVDIPVGFAELLTSYRYSDDAQIYMMEKRTDKAQKAQRALQKGMDEIHAKIQANDNPNEDAELHKEVRVSLENWKSLANSLMTDDERTVKISMKLYLEFLTRKLKDDRNNIIHGKYSLFKEDWITLLYLTALEELLMRIGNYEQKAGSLGIGTLTTTRN